MAPEKPKTKDEVDDSAFICGNAIDASLREILQDKNENLRHVKPLDVKKDIEEFLGLFKLTERNYFYDELSEIFEAKKAGTLDYSVYAVIVEPNPFEDGLYVAQFSMVEFDKAHDLSNSQDEKAFWGTKVRSIDLSLYTTIRLLLSLHNDCKFLVKSHSPLEENIELDYEVAQIYSFAEYKKLGSLISSASPYMSRKIEQLEATNKQYKLNQLFD